jgi:hypothetical protein
MTVGNITADSTVTPSAATHPFNTTDGSWASIATGTGDGLVTSHVGCQLITHAFTSNIWTFLAHTALSFNLSEELPLSKWQTITAATIKLKAAGKDIGGVQPWPNDRGMGVGIVTLDESVKTSSAMGNADFQAIYQGGRGEVSNILGYSTFNAGVVATWTLNAAGLAYLNYVWHKSLYKPIAYFGLMFGGEIDDLTPSWGNSADSYVLFDGAQDTSKPTLNITYSPNTRINVGDSWKPIKEIYINIGDSWKVVDQLKTNIGDVWKDSLNDTDPGTP